MLMDTVCLLEVIEATDEKMNPPHLGGADTAATKGYRKGYADGVAACIAELVKQGYITILKEGGKK